MYKIVNTQVGQRNGLYENRIYFQVGLNVEKEYNKIS